MFKNKEKNTLKPKSGDLLETAPASLLTCEKLQEDQFQINKDEESSMTDISMNMESSSETPKKKQKRKHLSEQHSENDYSEEQLTDGQQENRKIKKKMKLRNKEASHDKDTNDEDAGHSVNTEESPRKKKKREKTMEVNDATEFETQSNELSEETPTKKKKEKWKMPKENIDEQSKEQEEGNLSVESEMQSNEMSEETPTEKWKIPKENIEEQSKEQEEGNLSVESEMQSNEMSEETPTKKKKKKQKMPKEHIEEQSKEPEEGNLTVKSETQSNEISEKTPTKKKKKKRKMPEENIEEQSKETEEGYLTVESETQSNDISEKTPTKKKKKKRKMPEENIEEQSEETEEGYLTVESETQSNEISEKTPTKKKKKKRKMPEENIEEQSEEPEEGNLAVESETQSNKELAKTKQKSKCKDHESQTEQHKNLKSETSTSPVIISQDSKRSIENDEYLLKQMKEFIPNIESRELVSVKKMIKYDLPRFKKFKKEGIPLNRGRFTAHENNRLRKNVKDFMCLTAIDSATKLFFPNRFVQDKENIKKLKEMHKFFERIAEGIPRSCYYVYARGRKMFDEQNYQGEFTKEELQKLHKLHTLHGNNWKKISELTGRSALSLQKRYTQLGYNQGPWSRKEIQRLLRAVKDHVVSAIPGRATGNMSLRVKKETLYKGLPLQKISMKVKTRSWSQCKEKWMGILAVKMSYGAVYTAKKSLDVQVKLIKRMYEVDVDDVANVNWEDLAELIGDVPPAYLQKKWHKLKVAYVPDFHRKCFVDIVDFLYTNILPNLEEKLMSQKGLDETEDEENRESCLLSNIFQDINEDEDVEEDDEEEEDRKEGTKKK